MSGRAAPIVPYVKTLCVLCGKTQGPPHPGSRTAEKKTGKVLVFSEEEKFLNACADSFASFLEAFTVLINLEAALGRKKEVADPLAILNEAVAAAGGEEYQAFYKFIFPISIEKMLN